MNRTSRSLLLSWLQQIVRRIENADTTQARQRTRAKIDPGRRLFLQSGTVLAAATGIEARAAQSRQKAPNIAVIGGGLAGLTAAYELGRAGIDAHVFEASSRLGGRCYSDRDTFVDRQITERGGELIDSDHRHILKLTRRLGLTLDDVLIAEAPGTDSWIWFDGSRYDTETAVHDFQPVYPVVRAQKRAISDPSHRGATAAARKLDKMSVADWIGRHVPGGQTSRLGRYIRAALEENYATEAENISALIVVAMLATSTRRELDTYGGSDQRFHVREGNDAIATRMAATLRRPVRFESPLVALARRNDQRCDVTIQSGSELITETYDRVILALPFANLRDVDLSRAAFRSRKLRAIRELPMGASTKMQLQFDHRLWRDLGNTGYLMVDGMMSTWEVTRAQTGNSGILNVWTSGRRATASGEGSDIDQAKLALAEIERILPGVSPVWNGRVSRTVWDASSGPKGSYVYYPPGYLTSLLGVEAESEGPFHFAGEHTSREAQGFLEGAVESGQRAAREVLKATWRA